MKHQIVIIIILIAQFSCSNHNVKKTDNFFIGGEYGWAGPNEGDPGGSLLIYPISEDSFSFYIDYFNGSQTIIKYTGIAAHDSRNKFLHVGKNREIKCDLIFNCDSNFISIETINPLDSIIGVQSRKLGETFMLLSPTIPEFYNDSGKIIYLKDLR
jgi:hypothetical protein